MKKLLLVVAVGCSLSSITAPPLRRDVKDRRIGHHLLVEKRRKPTPVLQAQFGPLILRYGPQVHRYRPDVDYLDTLRTRKK